MRYLLFAFGAALAACTGSTMPAKSTDSTHAVIQPISVSPASVTMIVGETVTFAMTIPGGTTAKWRSSDTNVVTIDAHGSARARGVGSATILGSLASDPTVAGAAFVNVVQMSVSSRFRERQIHAALRPVTRANSSAHTDTSGIQQVTVRNL